MKWIAALVMVGACGVRGDSAATQQAKLASDQIVAMQATVDRLAAQVTLANQQLAAIGQQLAELRTSMTAAPTTPVIAVTPVDSTPSATPPPAGIRDDPFASSRPTRPKPTRTAAERQAWCQQHFGDIECLE